MKTGRFSISTKAFLGLPRIGTNNNNELAKERKKQGKTKNNEKITTKPESTRALLKPIQCPLAFHMLSASPKFDSWTKDLGFGLKQRFRV